MLEYIGLMLLKHGLKFILLTTLKTIKRISKGVYSGRVKPIFLNLLS
jgi:hypothetical protein